MKKIFRLFAAFAATTFAFSCMEEANPETPVIGNGGTSYEGPMVTLTFAVDELTKTSYDKENGHQWSEGDKIKIVYGTEDDAYTVAEVVNGAITATVGDVETYYAVYPEKTEYNLTIADNGQFNFAVTIPEAQNGSFKEANIMAAKTSKEERMFAFKNLTHILKFYMSPTSEFHGFRFLTNSSSDIILRGSYPVTFNDDNTINLGTATGGSRYIACVGLTGTGPFYVGIAPSVNMDYGFAVCGTRSDKNTGWAETALTTDKLAVERSTITNINVELDKVLHNDWYIKENATGRGDGTDWDNAGDILTLLKLIGNEIVKGVEYNGNTNCLRLNNAKIYIAEGEYDIPTALGADYLNLGNKWGYDKKDPTHKTEILGGYPSNASGKDITTRNVDVYQTKFVNPYKAQNNRIFSIPSGKYIPDLTIDGIVFTKSSNAGTVDTGRGRIMLCTKARGKMTFNNCRFLGLNTSANLGASVINIRQESSSDFVVDFNNCQFKNNTNSNASTYGGVIMLEPDTKNATVNISKCLFESNSTAVVESSNKAKGGAIYAAAGVVNIAETAFNANMGGSYGGAIYVEDNASVFVDNSTFTGNTATYGGAAYVTSSSAKLTLNGSTLSNNTSTNGGALANYASVMVVDNCVLNKNFASNQGGAIVSYDAALADPYTAAANKAYSYIYNSSFDSNYVQKSDGAESGNQGATIKAHGSGYIAIVNSTFTGGNGKVGTIRLRCGKTNTTAQDGVKCWIISSTIAKDRSGFWNQGSDAKLYNTINHENTTAGGTGGTYTTAYISSIYDKKMYSATSESTSLGTDDILGDFADGVFPATGAAATNGMSSTDLAALGAEGSALMTAMPLFDATKLTVDQKGYSRVGKTIMGAYVGQ